MTKEERKGKNQKKRAVRKANLMAVLNFVKENTDDTGLLSAVKFLMPGSRIVRTTAKDIILGLFVDNSIINENELFANYKIGRVEMRKIIRRSIKNPDTAEKMWISFDPETGDYTLEGRGADVPEGWTGYTPITIEDMELE